MFLTEKKNSNGLYYLYLMDSSWDPAAKRTKIRIVESFGKVDDFKREKPEQYAELVEKYHIMQAPTFVVVNGDEFKKYLNASNIKKYVESEQGVTV